MLRVAKTCMAMLWALLLVVACGPDGPTPQPTFSAEAVLTKIAVAEMTAAPTGAPSSSQAPTKAVDQTQTPAATLPSAQTPTPTQNSGVVASPEPARNTPTRVATTIATQASATATPTSANPTATPGPEVTRTPSSPGVCPPPSQDVPQIDAIEPGVSIADGFEPQIRAFVDAGGSAIDLRDSLSQVMLDDGNGTIWQPKAQAVSVDVTGNGTHDVVVSLAFFVEGQYAEGALYVYSCQAGHYEGGVITGLAGQVPVGGGPDPGMRAIQDMNSNGVAEIALSYIEVIGTHGNFTRMFRILEWDGAGFVDLVQNDSWPENAAPVQNGDGAVYDTNGNLNLELVLTNGIGQGYPDGGPQRVRTDRWAWDGTAFRAWRLEHTPPEYRFQAVQDGDDAVLVERFETALGFYQQAIEDDQLLGWSQGQLWPDSAYGAEAIPEPDPDEYSRLSAYALYRSLLVYTALEDVQQAQQTMELLDQGFADGTSGAPYRSLAAVFWQTYQARKDMGVACAKAIQYAEAHSEEILTPLGSNFYGQANRGYAAQDVCPLGR